jgi:tetratricopeptide (TPR) repeat protein
VGEAIINANIMEHAFYWDPTSRNNQLVRENLQPDGFLFRVTPTPLPLSAETLKIHQGKIESFFNSYSKVFSRYNDREENLLYSIALENIARFFYEHQIYSQSIAHLSLANRLTPGSVTILNGLGASYANANHLLEAKQSFEKSLQHEPTNKTTLENLGQLYLDTREYEKAYALFQRLLKKDPLNQKAFIGIGSYYENARDIAKAREAYQLAVAVNPKNALAREARKKLSSLNSNLTKKEW